MKITDIQADNVLAIKSINLKLRTAVSLICGRNGSLKSSIFDVISMAVAQEPMRAVVLKKDYGQLVHDGAKAGGGLVVMNGDPDQAYGFNLPKGEFTEPASPEYRVSDSMRVALNGQNFAKMDAKARLVFLRTLTKIRSTKEVIVPMLLEAAGLKADAVPAVFALLQKDDWNGISKLSPMLDGLAPKIGEVTAQLRGGFTAAEEYAKERALESKRLWCSTTGRKSYGKDVAETWEMELPPVPAGDVETLKAMVTVQETAITTANQSIGAINQIKAQADADAATRKQLEGAPERVEALTVELTAADKLVAELLPKVEALRERAKGTARVGLVHDLALFIHKHPIKEAKAAIAGAELVGRYQDEYGPIAEVGTIDAEAKAALPAEEKAFLAARADAGRAKSALAVAIQQKAEYDVLAPAGEAVDTSAELAEVKTLLADAQFEKQRLQNMLLDIAAAHKNREEATKKTADAKKHHGDIAQWLFIADQMAPAGIPGQLLAAALKPVNAMLEQAQVDTGWPSVVITDDGDIIAGGRPRALQSESFQYRADAMIAQMVATISGIKIMLLDRFDMLDLPGRAELFSWIDTLVDVGDIDTALIFGTLKELPRAGLPESFTAYWVEGGTVTEVAEPELEEVAA
ncbi:MAG: hypothetical protein V4641_16345 [Pseudomonadota bacterium]